MNRPTWCPHQDCAFKRVGQDVVCGGELPALAHHDGVPNTHRICFNGAAENGAVLDLQVNTNDLDWFRWIFDALDGKATSWLSQRQCSCDEWEPGTAKINAPISLAQARNPHLTQTPEFQFTPFRFCPWCGKRVRTPLVKRGDLSESGRKTEGG